jgi:2-polyprenyl-3-methyl-5-hydroxy-6-metoxy-1,4-benzoquinol methylase
MSSRLLLEELTGRISRDYPVLARGLLANQLGPDDPLWDSATLALEHVVRITGGDDDRMGQCVEAFVVTSLDFLRLQARFMRTGRYARSSAVESSTLYDDADRMTEYLDGLALTYAMWPNHARMLQFYVGDFVPLVADDGAVLEIGPGHGLLASVLLARREDVRYLGIDISPRSLSYSAAAFSAAEIAADRYELALADASGPSTVLSSRATYDAAICCEVLEHVDDPAALLATLCARTAVGAPAFVSTVANMEAEDHVYLFHDEDDIRTFLHSNGFVVDADQPLALAGAQSMAPTPLNYSAIIRSR